MKMSLEWKHGVKGMDGWNICTGTKTEVLGWLWKIVGDKAYRREANETTKTGRIFGRV